jgi:hypothetical protein
MNGGNLDYGRSADGENARLGFDTLQLDGGALAGLAALSLTATRRSPPARPPAAAPPPSARA